MANHRDVAQAIQPLLTLLEGLRRDVDQVDASAAAASLERLGKEHDLLAAAASELDDRAFRLAQGFDDRGRVPRQQLRLGARDAVPRQPADGVEQARAERVVEILRLQWANVGTRERVVMML